ncbi:AMP-binding protein [Bordetella genomosp. 1]|uniref:ATP-dependent acyl-CoA ligase n=1 Tax=Bordetella genomosp. 1 TaxID=1395607 RepID=A0ABX4F7Y9_9BORD|nr:AMP-binding protein [Bordetella genomosp. 1]OZI69241.1 ATP-dependent acyl-CoA ligase [Bordetella genomosp. 1]
MSTTVYQAYIESARQWPQHAFVCVLPETAGIYGIDAGELSYADAAARIETLRAAYEKAGYGHGHRAGLLLENRPAFFLHWFALNALGVSVVPINQDLRAAELEYLTGHSEIALAVALPQRHDDLRAAARRAGRELVVIGPDETVPPAPFAPPRAGEPLDEQTECALLYTSGTTGRPKGCILPNRYFLHAGRWYAESGGLVSLRPGAERMLTPLPLVHMNAMAYSAMAMVLTGGCLITLDRFHPRTWWDSVRASRATVLHYLGVMPAMLMKAPAADSDRDHQVRFGFGAGVERGLHAPFEERFGFPLLEAWAMTETGAGAVVIANEEPRHIGSNCFGREGAEVQVRIVADDGSDAAAGEPGELLVRHGGDDPRYGFFAGYLKDAEATDAAWEGGWFHTGDIVRRDADGALRFVDRKKNVIRRSGENISAVEVEAVLLRHPLVKSAAVAAVPDAVRGDEVLVCVVAEAEPADAAAREAAARELVGWCLEQLAYYKAPGYVAFVDALPLTTTNKIQRGEMKTWAPTLPGTARCVDTRALKKRQEHAA